MVQMNWRMNKLPKFLSRQTSRCFPEKWIFSRKIPSFLPFYHVVSDETLSHILNYPYRNTSQFEQELDFFLKYYRPVSLKELVSGACEFGQRKVFHLSFDDGLCECADVIAPILLRKGIPATFFINTAFIDNKELFHKYKASLILNQLQNGQNDEVEKLLRKHNLGGRFILKAVISQVKILDEAAQMLGIDFDEFLRKQKPYLTSGQVKKLADAGFSIGAHSHNHPEFGNIPVQDQIEEVKVSIEYVKKLVNPPVSAFSFPFTDSDVPAHVLQTIKNEHICDVTFGTAGIKKDVFEFHFQRYPAEQNGPFIRNLKSEIIYYEMRRWAGKATVKH
jgi:peptidoglycan/xylan/chitin deacetylase (PgdA/CDA1 family)